METSQWDFGNPSDVNFDNEALGLSSAGFSFAKIQRVVSQIQFICSNLSQSVSNERFVAMTTDEFIVSFLLNCMYCHSLRHYYIFSVIINRGRRGYFKQRYQKKSTS